MELRIVTQPTRRRSDTDIAFITDLILVALLSALLGVYFIWTEVQMSVPDSSVGRSQSFDAEIVESVDDLNERLEHIHSLPVIREIVKEPGQYEFSSYNNYHKARRTSVQLVIDQLPKGVG